MIKLHEIRDPFNEQKISDQKNHIEKLCAQVEELEDESDFHQRLKIKI